MFFYFDLSSGMVKSGDVAGVSIYIASSPISISSGWRQLHGITSGLILSGQGWFPHQLKSGLALSGIHTTYNPKSSGFGYSGICVCGSIPSGSIPYLQMHNKDDELYKQPTIKSNPFYANDRGW